MSPNKSTIGNLVTMTQNQVQLLHKIASLKSTAKLCDVHFLVGKSTTKDKTRIVANSTLLALRSEVFEAKFFGEDREVSSNMMSSNGRVLEIVVEDVDASTFQEMIDFITASSQSSDDELDFQNGSTTFIKSMKHAWEMKSVGMKFVVNDLIRECNAFLYEKLTFRNSLEFLVYAKTYSDDEFRRRVFEIMKNRGDVVVNSAKASVVRQLTVADVMQILELFSYVKTDCLIKFLEVWGSDMEKCEFIKIFRTQFSPKLRWDNITRNGMVHVHDAQLLGQAEEIQAFMKLLSADQHLIKLLLYNQPFPRPPTYQTALEFSAKCRPKKNFLLKGIALVIVEQGSTAPIYVPNKSVVSQSRTWFQLDQNISNRLNMEKDLKEIHSDKNDAAVLVKGGNVADANEWVKPNLLSVILYKRPNYTLIKCQIDPVPLTCKKSSKLSNIGIFVQINSLLLCDLQDDLLISKSVPSKATSEINIPEKKMKFKIADWSSRLGPNHNLFKNGKCDQTSIFISALEFK